MTCNFRCVSQSGQEIYQSHDSLLSLLSIFTYQVAKFRQMGDPLVSGSLRKGDTDLYFLKDEHWILMRHRVTA